MGTILAQVPSTPNYVLGSRASHPAMVSEVGDVVCFRGRDCEVVQVAEAYRECFGIEPARCALKSVLGGGAVEWTDLAKFAQASQGGACKVYVRRIAARAAVKATLDERFQQKMKAHDSLKDSQMVKTIFERSDREGWSEQRVCDEVSELCQLVAPGRRTLGAFRPGAEPFDGSSIDKVVATTTQQWHPGKPVRQEGGEQFFGGQIWKFEIFTFQFETFSFETSKLPIFILKLRNFQF